MHKKVMRHALRVTGGVIAIVPAAGLGKRFGTSTKKPFVAFSGVPLLIHTLKRLYAVRTITEIIPVLGKEDIKRGFKLIKDYKLNKVKRIAIGGKERQDSVYNALRLIESGHNDLILIHDGVRPLITQDLIEKVLNEFTGKNSSSIDGVILGLPVKETLKEVRNSGVVISTKRREHLWAIQTPQVFRFNVFKKAYDSAYRDGFYATDDAALVERIGGKIKVILGHPYNIKVTTPEDAEMVRYLLKNSEQ